MIRAYNARSTRPIWHWWKPYAKTDGQDWSGEPWRRALCGAKARDDMLDQNVGHIHGCGECDKRQRKLVTT